MATHVLNKSTRLVGGLGCRDGCSGGSAGRGGLTWILGAFTAVLSVYVVTDAIAGRVTADRVLTHSARRRGLIRLDRVAAGPP
jgi:hypothetical protein